MWARLGRESERVGVGRERGREMLGLGSEAVADAGALRKRYAHEARRAARAKRVARAALQSFETRSAREFSHRQSLARGDAGGKGLGGDVLLGCAATGEIGRSSGGGSVDEEAAAPAANTSATQRCAARARGSLATTDTRACLTRAHCTACPPRAQYDGPVVSLLAASATPPLS